VIGFSELGGESLTAILVDRLGKSRAVALGLVANCLAALALPVLGRSLPGAFVGLFLFYLTFEFTVVSSIPLMSEVVPSARATLMATSGASHALGRAMSDLIAPSVYALGFWGSCLAAVVFNLLALWALSRLRKTVDEREKPLQSLPI
jgi:predicted MFS family arabinose efflux permease